MASSYAEAEQGDIAKVWPYPGFGVCQSGGTGGAGLSRSPAQMGPLCFMTHLVPSAVWVGLGGSFLRRNLRGSFRPMFSATSDSFGPRRRR